MSETALARAEGGPPAGRPLPVAITFRQFVWVWNRLQDFGTPELHVDIARWLEDRWSAGDERLLLMVFRDAGKSTLTGLYCAWLLLQDPNLRILVLSAEHQLASKMVKNVRGIIEKHPLTRQLVPGRADQWGSDKVTVERSREQRDPSLLARGLAANLTGTRADVVICDDVEVPNTADAHGKREDLRARLSELSFILVPGGLQLYVGTPHSHLSIYADAADLPADMKPFLGHFNRLILPLIDEKGRCRWAERFTPAKVEAIRQEAGPLRFQSQMLLKPVDLREVRLDAARLKVYAAEPRLIEGNGERRLMLEDRELAGGVCWWDPSFGDREKSDGSVVAVLYNDRQGGYWLSQLAYLSHDPTLAEEVDEATQMCRQVTAIMKAAMLTSVTVETNGIGAFLPNLLRRSLRAERLPFRVLEHNSSTNKDRRIVDAFDPILAARSLHVHERVMAGPLPDEMRNFRPGGRNRDDGIDAVANALVCESGPLALGRLYGLRTYQANTAFSV
ncbi:MAG: phage terminase large subunit [Geminicoccaceae bacterium]